MSNKYKQLKIVLLFVFIAALFFAGSYKSYLYAAEAKTEEKKTKEEIEKEKELEQLNTNKRSRAKVVYPANNMVMYEQRDWITGIFRDMSADTVNIKIVEAETGEEIESADAEVEDNGLFMYPVEFVAGINRIKVNNDFEIDVFYQEDLDVTPPAKFKEVFVHQSVPDLCQECHDIFDESGSFKLNEENLIDICENCHKSKIYNRLRKTYKNIHEPVKEGQCTTCHEIHISANEHMLIKPQNELCADCHKGFINGVKSKKHIHLGDMFDRICTKCHNPHSSNIKNLIRDVRKGICTKCHEIFSGEKEGVEYKSIHKPVVQGKCYLCHEIHQGRNKMFLIKEDTKGTCVACHGDKLSTGHGAKLGSCTECHNAHISEKEGLFTDKGIKKCLSCHKDLKYKKEIVQKENCQSCHNPHSNVNIEMAMASCNNCHDKEKLIAKHSDLSPSFEKCPKCHQMHGDIGKSLLRKNSHPLKEKRCKGCHTNKHIDTARNACLECHKGVYEAKHPNTIGVEGMCIKCHNVHGGGEEKMLSKVQHKPFAEGKCKECHKSVDESLLLPEKASSGELCLSCHKDIDLDKGPDFGKDTASKGKKAPAKRTPKPTAKDKAPEKKYEPYKVKHKPFEQRECIECHETHASKYPRLQLDEGAHLCYMCHKNKEVDERGEPMFSIHQPINLGNCLKCHRPHGSEYEKVLKKKGQDLCFNCHDNFLIRKGRMPRARGGLASGKMSEEDEKAIPLYKTIHKPILEKGCTACHNPHSSSTKKLLVSEGDKFFCYKCHEDFTLDDDGNQKKSIHDPVLKGECVKCHEKHANDNPKLLVKLPNLLCLGCHRLTSKHHQLLKPALDRMVKVPESFVLDKIMIGCTNCHSPHASNVEFLFVNVKEKLCTLCHSSVP